MRKCQQRRRRPSLLYRLAAAAAAPAAAAAAPAAPAPAAAAAALLVLAAAALLALALEIATETRVALERPMKQAGKGANVDSCVRRPLLQTHTENHTENTANNISFYTLTVPLTKHGEMLFGTKESTNLQYILYYFLSISNTNCVPYRDTFRY